MRVGQSGDVRVSQPQAAGIDGGWEDEKNRGL